MIRQLILITILFVSFITAQIPDGLLPMIQKDELLSEGGSDLIEWNSDSTYIVGVSAVEVKKKKRNTFVSGYILASGKVYITTNNGYLIVCSAKTGKTEYLKKIGDKIASNPIINNGSLYILTAESRLLGFN